MAKTSTTPTLDKFREIESMHEDADIELRKVLGKRGWDYTSSTPGHIWMFRKVVNGETILTNAATAQTIEEDLCGEEYDEND